MKYHKRTFREDIINNIHCENEKSTCL